jgi:hypothetical protein
MVEDDAGPATSQTSIPPAATKVSRLVLLGAISRHIQDT